MSPPRRPYTRCRPKSRSTLRRRALREAEEAARRRARDHPPREQNMPRSRSRPRNASPTTPEVFSYTAASGFERPSSENQTAQSANHPTGGTATSNTVSRAVVENVAALLQFELHRPHTHSTRSYPLSAAASHSVFRADDADAITRSTTVTLADATKSEGNSKNVQQMSGLAGRWRVEHPEWLDYSQSAALKKIEIAEIGEEGVSVRFLSEPDESESGGADSTLLGTDVNETSKTLSTTLVVGLLASRRCSESRDFTLRINTGGPRDWIATPVGDEAIEIEEIVWYLEHDLEKKVVWRREHNSQKSSSSAPTNTTTVDLVNDAVAQTLAAAERQTREAFEMLRDGLKAAEKREVVPTCKICLENPVSVLLLGCGHTMCAGCAERQCQPGKACFICKAAYEGRHKLFFS